MEAVETRVSFSLLGGPLHRIGQRLGLVLDRTNLVPLGLALGWFSWLVLLGLALAAGVAGKLFTLAAIAADARLLIVIPLFFMCETALDSRMRTFVSMIVRSGVVPGSALPAWAAQIARTLRWKDALLPEGLCLLVALLSPMIAAQFQAPGKTPALDATSRFIGELPLAGAWYGAVCLPLFRFLLLRWLWRIALWGSFLWRLARLDLHLVPIHPDGAAGLGYLEVVQTHFVPFAMALSILVSASFAEEISAGRMALTAIYPAAALMVLTGLAIVLLPPCVFAFKLRASQERGLSDYMILAGRYVNDFEAKWLLSHSDPGEPLLGTADLQSLADLSSSVGIVRSMRRAPVSMRLTTITLVAILAPMAPLFLFEYPLAEIAQRLVKKLAGL